MNPIYAADRGVISTLAQALDIAERFDAADVGVVVDTFHLWWEPDIDEQLRRAGERIVSYQICDWITPLPADTLLARGMMGDGHIDFPTFTRSVAGRLSRRCRGGDLQCRSMGRAPGRGRGHHGGALSRTSTPLSS